MESSDSSFRCSFCGPDYHWKRAPTTVSRAICSISKQMLVVSIASNANSAVHGIFEVSGTFATSNCSATFNATFNSRLGCTGSWTVSISTKIQGRSGNESSDESMRVRNLVNWTTFVNRRCNVQAGPLDSLCWTWMNQIKRINQMVAHGGFIPQTGLFYHMPHQAGQPLIESNLLTNLEERAKMPTVIGRCSSLFAVMELAQAFSTHLAVHSFPGFVYMRTDATSVYWDWLVKTLCDIMSSSSSYTSVGFKSI